MKKFLFLALVAFASATASAQVVTSTSYTKAKSETIWYVKVGANFANLSADGESGSSIIGYNVGIAFDKAIGTSGAFWNAGLQLATKGTKEEYGGYESKLVAHKLEIPLTFGYKFEAGDDITIDGRVGGFVNYDLFGKVKETDNDGYEASYNLGDLEDYDRLSAGIQFGVGVWYQKLNLNITYQLGLVEQNECKERNWMISLGYAF